MRILLICRIIGKSVIKDRITLVYLDISIRSLFVLSYALSTRHRTFPVMVLKPLEILFQGAIYASFNISIVLNTN